LLLKRENRIDGMHTFTISAILISGGVQTKKGSNGAAERS
jgi:hypothetical protein